MSSSEKMILLRLLSSFKLDGNDRFHPTCYYKFQQHFLLYFGNLDTMFWVFMPKLLGIKTQIIGKMPILFRV